MENQPKEQRINKHLVFFLPVDAEKDCIRVFTSDGLELTDYFNVNEIEISCYGGFTKATFTTIVSAGVFPLTFDPVPTVIAEEQPSYYPPRTTEEESEKQPKKKKKKRLQKKKHRKEAEVEQATGQETAAEDVEE